MTASDRYFFSPSVSLIIITARDRMPAARMPPLAGATVTTLFLLCTTRAMELEERDHSESWAAAGLVDQFAVTYAQALPDALLAEVEAALPSLKPRQVPFGDGRTIEHNWWLQLYDGGGARNSPKSSVEVALHALSLIHISEPTRPY